MPSPYPAERRPIDVVIVTYNAVPYLEDLRDHLTPQLGPSDQVVILDNASSDETLDWLAANWPEATVIASAINHFFAAGNNLATEKTSADVVFYLNQDTRPGPGTLDIVAANTQPDQACTVAQEFPWSEFPLVPYLDWSGTLLWREPEGEVESTTHLSGGAFALHRRTLERLGGIPFDPRIKQYCEDTHLSLRLSELGVRQVALSGSSIFHDSKPSKGNRLMDFRRAIPIQRNMLRAHLYALGPTRTLLRLPLLLAAGWRKADVDGQGTLARRLGLTLATWIGFGTAGRGR